VIALIDRLSRPTPYRRYDGAVVYIRPPSPRDRAEWTRLRAESRAFLEPWEPTWAADALGSESYRRRLQRYVRDARDDAGYAFFVFRNRDDALVGGVNVSNVSRGIRMSCSIGYWIGERYARNGYMTDSVRLVLEFAFDGLSLHRVEAGCVPGNLASGGLLRKLGFRQEGMARQYLHINGQWHDHLLFAILASDPWR